MSLTDDDDTDSDAAGRGSEVAAAHVTGVGTPDRRRDPDHYCPSVARDATSGEFLVGVEGLALLRLAFDDAADARASRLAELRGLLSRIGDDPGLDEPMAGAEHGVEAGYRIWSETYDRPLRLFSLEEPPMLRRIDRLSNGTVLDAACGSGRYSAHLVERGHDVIGVDRSEAMLDLARGKLPQATFRRGDLTDLPVDDGAVDASVCALALVHVEDLDAAMSELARVLRPGGRLIISDVHPFLVSLGWQAQFPTGDDGRGFMRLHRHHLSEYVAAALRCGLVVRGCEEPLLTEAGARTAAAELIPDANRQAFVGLPAVVVWELERS